MSDSSVSDSESGTEEMKMSPFLSELVTKFDERFGCRINFARNETNNKSESPRKKRLMRNEPKETRSR